MRSAVLCEVGVSLANLLYYGISTQFDPKSSCGFQPGRLNSRQRVNMPTCMRQIQQVRHRYHDTAEYLRNQLVSADLINSTASVWLNTSANAYGLGENAYVRYICARGSTRLDVQRLCVVGTTFYLMWFALCYLAHRNKVKYLDMARSRSLTIAVDFGTTYSGVAFYFSKGLRDEVGYPQ